MTRAASTPRLRARAIVVPRCTLQLFSRAESTPPSCPTRASSGRRWYESGVRPKSYPVIPSPAVALHLTHHRPELMARAGTGRSGATPWAPLMPITQPQSKREHSKPDLPEAPIVRAPRL